MSLSTKLKENTRGAHTSTEEATFNKDLMKGILPLESYGMFLESILMILGSLEFEMNNSTQPTIQSLNQLMESKIDLIGEDLKCSQLCFPNMTDSLQSLSISLVEEISNMSTSELIGVFYVFEGSSLGGKFIKKTLEQRLDNGQGVNYLSVYGNSVRTHWKNIQETLDSFVLTEDEEKKVISAADRTFEMIEEIQNLIHRKAS